MPKLVLACSPGDAMWQACLLYVSQLIWATTDSYLGMWKTMYGNVCISVSNLPFSEVTW